MDDHQADAKQHHASVAGDVSDARAAVVATTRSLDRIADLLHRHFRALMLALACAAVVAALLIYLVAQVKAVVRTVEVQALANEVEVLRHRVHSKESDLRLCTVALGASRGREEAERICAPVLGPEYEETKARLAGEERRLAELREELR